MKTNLAKHAVGFLLLATASSAEMEVGRGAVALDTALSGTYDSNLRDSADALADYYLTLFPLVRYRDTGSRFTTDASAGVQFKRYLDHTAFNSDDANAHLTWQMLRTEGDTVGAGLEVGYVETSDAVVEVNDRVKTRNFFASASGEVLVAGRNLLSAGLSYRDAQHNVGSDQTSGGGRVGYSYLGFTDGTTVAANYSYQQTRSTDHLFGLALLDQTANTTSLTVGHPLFAGLDAAATYGYRWLDRGTAEAALGLPDRHGPIYDFSLKGSFLPKQYFPKTTGTFQVAYEQADAPGLNDRSYNRVIGLVNIAWAARERTTVNVYGSRSQDLSITDNTVVNDRTGLKITQGIGAFLNANLDLRYTNANFVNLARNDDRYEVLLSGAYKLNRSWEADLGYSYLDSISDAAIANFRRHIATLTVHYVF